jgi:glycosyltransferase involved in cell wall biosynthesis
VLTTNANGPDAVLDVPANREVEVAAGVRATYAARIGSEAISLPLLAKLPALVRWADVVHVTPVYSFPAIPTMLACRLAGKPLVWSPRGGLQRWSGSRRVRLKDAWDFVCRMVQPKGTVLHVTSEQEAAESQARYPKLRTALIPNGVPAPETLRRREGNGTLRLVYLGRLHPKKGIENLLEALAAIGDSLRCSLVIAGKGEAGYTASLRRRIEELKLSGIVQMAGEVIGADKQAVLENADLAVFPSHTENFGLVIAEAMAHGLPVIASRGTPWQTVEFKGCGMWVENDPQTLKDAILRFSKLPMREMGMRGREWMLESFSWEGVASATIALYRSLIGSSVTAPNAVGAQKAI